MHYQIKKYNKRLETALKKIDEHFTIDNRYGLYLEYNFYDTNERSFLMDNGQTYYISNYKHIILGLSNLGKEGFVTEGLAELLLGHASVYKQEYEELEKQLPKVQDIILEYKTIVATYNTFEDKINDNIQSILDLRLQRV